MAWRIKASCRAGPSTLDLNRYKPETSSIGSFARSFMPLLDIRNLTVTFATRRGAFTAVDGIDVTLRPQRGAGDRRRVRVGQVGGDARRDGPPAADRDRDRRPHGVRRRRSHGDVGERAPPARRQGHGDDLSGADVLAEPLLHRRLPDRRGAEDPSRPRPQGARQARRRAVSPRSAFPTPSAGRAPFPTSSRAA